MTLTDAQRAAFATDGYVVVADLFSDDECALIAAEIEAAAFHLDLGDEVAGPLTYRPMMHLASPPLEAVATDARWADIVPALLGEADVRLYWEQAVAKPAHAHTVLPWHQDNGYTPLEPEQYLTCWLALDDAEVDNGCLWVIPASHRNGTRPHHNDDRHGPFRVRHRRWRVPHG